MNARVKLLWVGLCSALAAGAGCGGGDEGGGSGGSAGSIDASSEATGGSSGSVGLGGSGGTSGSAGAAATGGSGGSGGSAGASGAAGSGGAAGSAGAAGVGGSAGVAGTGGGAGAAGSAGTAGAGGSAGSGGAAGSAGSGGAAGGAGSGGAAGSAGSAGGDASAGAGGSAGGDAGADAAPECLTGADCDNSVFCDGVEQCISGTCVAGIPLVCPDDGAACTLNVCDESSKQCITVPQDSACNDGLYCNGIEHCSPGATGANAAGCVAGTPPPCDDAIACTTNGCDEANDSCVYTPNHGACDDGQHCNGVEQCAPAQGGCVAGAAVNCEDGFACTQDACNELSDTCDHVPQDAACNNGIHCDGAEKCVVGQGCVDQADVACADDGIPCTIEACDEGSSSCQTSLDNSKCPSGQFCTFGGCIAGTSCLTSAECDDGIACNGVETCDTSTMPGSCKPGTPVACNDSIPCTLDQCQEPTGTCSHTPIHTFCNDGDVCNGSESCSPTLGCQAGTPLSCDDGVACTDNTCIASLGCAYLPNDAACQDASFCNGAETCSGQNGCQPAQGPVVCPDDGVACTSESCSETLQACVSAPNNALCPCGQTCNPQQGGCGNFCTVTACQGHVYQCGNCLDDDGDCKIDSADEYCIGVCSNNEQGYKGNIPGQNNSPCRMDCYFDQDTGPGNDDCYWNHKCDPYEVAPNYPPSGSKCAYDPNANTPGTNQSCAQLNQSQSQACHDYCGPLTPNGCDCFGCCSIPGAPTTVYLGSENSSGDGTCTLANVGDPSLCKPCTQVPACLNTCETCEICVGKPTLPPSCTEQSCPPGDQACGLPGQAPCPAGFYCVTGCCQPIPG